MHAAVRLAWSLIDLFNAVTSLALVWASSIFRLETVVVSAAIAVLSAMVAFANWVIASTLSC